MFSIYIIYKKILDNMKYFSNYLPLFESFRKSDAKKKFEKDIPEWNEIENSEIPPGYYYWVASEFLRLNRLIELNLLIDSVVWFNSVKIRLKEKDLYKKKGKEFYYTYSKLEDLMNKMGESKNSAKKLKGLVEKGTKVLYKDSKENMLIEIKNWEASKYWAHYYKPNEITEGRWCISTYSNRRNYDIYSKRGPIYMIILTDKPYIDIENKTSVHTNYGRIAIVKKNTPSNEFSTLEIWSADNKSPENILEIKSKVSVKLYSAMSKYIPEIKEMEHLLSEYKNRNSKDVKEGSEVLYESGDKFIVKVSNKAAALYWGKFKDETKKPIQWVNNIYDMSVENTDALVFRGYDLYLISTPKEKESMGILSMEDDISLEQYLWYGIKFGSNTVSYEQDSYYFTYATIRDVLIKNGLFKIVLSKIKTMAKAEALLKQLSDKHSSIIKDKYELLYDKNGETLIKSNSFAVLTSFLLYQNIPGTTRNPWLSSIEKLSVKNVLNYVYISKKLKKRYYIHTNDNIKVERFEDESDEKWKARYDKKSSAKSYLDDIKGTNIEVEDPQGTMKYDHLLELIRAKVPEEKEILKHFPGGYKYKSAANKISKLSAKEDNTKVKEGTTILYKDPRNILVNTTNKYADAHWTYKYVSPGIKPLRTNIDMMIKSDTNYKITKGATVQILVSSDMPEYFRRIKIYKGTNTGHVKFHIIGMLPKEVKDKLKNRQIYLNDYLMLLFKIYLPLNMIDYLVKNKYIKSLKTGIKRLKIKYNLHPYFSSDIKDVEVWDFSDREGGYEPYIKDFISFVFKTDIAKRANWITLNIPSNFNLFLFKTGPAKGKRIVSFERGFVTVYYDETGKNVTKWFNSKISSSYPVIKEYLDEAGFSDSEIAKEYNKASSTAEYKKLVKEVIDISSDRETKKSMFYFTSKKLYDIYKNDDSLKMVKIPKIYVSPKTFIGRYNSFIEDDRNPIYRPDFSDIFKGKDSSFVNFYKISFKWILDNINWTDEGLAKK